MADERELGSQVANGRSENITVQSSGRELLLIDAAETAHERVIEIGAQSLFQNFFQAEASFAIMNKVRLGVAEVCVLGADASSRFANDRDVLGRLGKSFMHAVLEVANDGAERTPLVERQSAQIGYQETWGRGVEICDFGRREVGGDSFAKSCARGLRDVHEQYGG